MNPSKPVLLLIVGLIAIIPKFAIAQEEEQAPVPQETPSREKLGHVRVWHFAETVKQPVTVAVSGGAADSVPLGSNLEYGSMMSYEDLRPAKYQLHVTAGDGGDEGKDIVQPIELAVENGGFKTVILRSQKNEVRAAVVDDLFRTATPGAARLRVFNFASGKTASLRTENDTVLFEKLPEGYSEKLFPKTGSMFLRLVFPLPNGLQANQSLEIDFNQSKSISLVVAEATETRLGVRAVQDATLE